MSLTRRKTSMWWTTVVTRGQNEKKALHQVLSKATVFTSFDLFLAELPFPQLSASSTLVLIFEVSR